MKRITLIVLGVLLLCVGPGVVMTGTLITFIMPEVFSSRALLKIDRAVSPRPGGETNSVDDGRMILTESEVIKSEVIPERVIHALSLNEEWGKRYAGGEKLKTRESLQLLRGQIDVRPIPGANIVEIVAYNERPGRAADIANGIANAYHEYVQEAGKDGEADTSVQLIERASPRLTPVKPNKQVNILLSSSLGLIFMFAGVVLLILGARSKEARRPA